MLGKGPSSMFSNSREKVRRLITWSVAVHLARKPAVGLGRIKATRGRRKWRQERRPQDTGIVSQADGIARTQALRPRLVAKGQSHWGHPELEPTLATPVTICRRQKENVLEITLRIPAMVKFQNGFLSQ